MCCVNLILFRPKASAEVGERRQTVPLPRTTPGKREQVFERATAVKFYKPTSKRFRQAGAPSPEPVRLSDAETGSVEGQ
jgi:hypothetical protein